MNPPTSPAPTRVRYGVLGFACSLSMVTYLDRVCFGRAAGEIQNDLGLASEADLKWAFTMFTVAYAAFEIPSGWLGDVYGPKRTLIRIVLWWSLFTMLTGCVTEHGFLFLSGLSGLGVLVVIRFLFGMGEAGAYPNITRALHNWFPASARGGAQGTVWMSGRLMGGLTPIVWLIVTQYLGLNWRGTFFLFGALGVLWCVAFTFWFRDRPRQHPAVNDSEAELIEAGRTDTGHAHANVPWMALLLSPNLWALCLMYACASYGWYFNITYLPRFLETQYRVDPNSLTANIYMGGPLLLGAFTCLIGGILSDRFIRRTGNRKWGRRLFGVVGHALCALCYLACLFTPTAFLFALAISMAAFWNDLTMGAAWATCQDVGKKYAAIVAGAMNTVGNLGGALANLVTGTILGLFFASGAAALGVTEKEQQDDVNYMVAVEIHTRMEEDRVQELADAIDASPEELIDLSVFALSGDLGKFKESDERLETLAKDLEWSVDQLKDARNLRDRVAREQRARFLLPGYRVNLLIFALVYLLAVFLWFFIDATKPVVPEERH